MSTKSKNHYFSNKRNYSNKKQKQSSSSKTANKLNLDISNKIDEGLQLQRAKAKLAVESLQNNYELAFSVQGIELSSREKAGAVVPRIYPSNLLRALQTREIGYSSGTSISKRWNSFNSVILSERLCNAQHCWVDASEHIIDLSYQENRGVIFCDKKRVYFLGKSKDPLWTKQSLTPSRAFSDRIVNFAYPSVFGLLSYLSHYSSVLWNEGVDSHTFAVLSRCIVNGQYSWLSLFDSTRMDDNIPFSFSNPCIADMDFELNTVDTGQEAICWCGKSGDLLSCGEAGIVVHHFDRRKSVYQLSIRAINAAVSAPASTTTRSFYSYDAACKCLPVCMAWSTERGALLFGLRSGGILMADGRLDGRRHSSGSCSFLGSLPFRVDHIQSLDAQGSILASDVVGSLQMFDMRVLPRSGKPTSSGRIVRECSGSSTSSIRPTDIKGRFYVSKDRKAVLIPAPPTPPSSSTSSSVSSKKNLLAYSLTEENTPIHMNNTMEVYPEDTTIAASSFFNFGSSDSSSDVIVGFLNPPSRISGSDSNISNISPYSMIFKSTQLQ